MFLYFRPDLKFKLLVTSGFGELCNVAERILFLVLEFLIWEKMCSYSQLASFVVFGIEIH